MAKYSKAEREAAVRDLEGRLQPGDTVHTILRHTSRSGMLRIIDPVALAGPGNDVRYLGYLTAKALGWPDDGDQGVKVSGCGMDMGFELVYCLSRALWPEGFECIGDSCPANDHMNARSSHCAVCGRSLDDEDASAFSHYRGRHPVCSRNCVTTEWRHQDGGYALKQRWL